MLSNRPLEGITVVEFGHSVAAPYAGLILGELGADVIKVENADGGDYARGWGPPFWEGKSVMFQVLNRSKSSVALDLKDTVSAERLREFIVEKADVVVHNMKFGAMERLGFGAEDLTAKRPDLIYCNCGAFGNTGPLRDRPGYDPLLQAFSGMMSMMGEEGRPSVRVAVSIVDMGMGLWAAIGILAALYERRRTGQGGRVDTSLLETALGWLTVPLGNYLASGDLPRREGSGAVQIVPYQAFEARDGEIMILAGNDGLFRKLAAAIERPDLPADPRFATNADRVKNRAVLLPILQEILGTQDVAHWEGLLLKAGVPHSPIQTFDQVLAHPQIAALGMLQTSPDEKLRIMGLPLSFDGQRPEFTVPAPAMGEHNALIGTPPISADRIGADLE
ncbi:CaiB/BaiF CoA transferase family protein [Croceicoccus sediminis]|uniref:CaiB/BaiF CoA transferase family protein n=1 Tax=Croceicoccus sediminis TaxID=2571150 RepID=UPI0011830081|nr:CoA transferase [Croceicoccus sediminis]